MSEWTIGRVFRWGTTGVGVFAVGVAGLGVGLGVTQPDYRTVSGVRALPLPTVTVGDPLVTPGQWMVGDDIAAGDYVAEVVSSAVAQALTYDKGSRASLRAELIDVCSVASAWIAALDKERGDGRRG